MRSGPGSLYPSALRTGSTGSRGLVYRRCRRGPMVGQASLYWKGSRTTLR